MSTPQTPPVSTHVPGRGDERRRRRRARTPAPGVFSATPAPRLTTPAIGLLPCTGPILDPSEMFITSRSVPRGLGVPPTFLPPILDASCRLASCSSSFVLRRCTPSPSSLPAVRPDGPSVAKPSALGGPRFGWFETPSSGPTPGLTIDSRAWRLPFLPIPVTPVPWRRVRSRRDAEGLPNEKIQVVYRERWCGSRDGLVSLSRRPAFSPRLSPPLFGCRGRKSKASAPIFVSRAHRRVGRVWIDDTTLKSVLHPTAASERFSWSMKGGTTEHVVSYVTGAEVTGQRRPVITGQRKASRRQRRRLTGITRPFNANGHRHSSSHQVR